MRLFACSSSLPSLLYRYIHLHLHVLHTTHSPMPISLLSHWSPSLHRVSSSHIHLYFLVPVDSFPHLPLSFILPRSLPHTASIRPPSSIPFALTILAHPSLHLNCYTSILPLYSSIPVVPRASIHHPTSFRALSFALVLPSTRIHPSLYAYSSPHPALLHLHRIVSSFYLLSRQLSRPPRHIIAVSRRHVHVHSHSSTPHSHPAPIHPTPSVPPLSHLSSTPLSFFLPPPARMHPLIILPSLCVYLSSLPSPSFVLLFLPFPLSFPVVSPS